MTAAIAPKELPRWRMAMYALPALPIAVLYLPLPLMIPPFYAEEFGLSLTVIGAFLFFARIFDFIIDPVLGRLSDTTRSRFGRRRPWIVIGAPIMVAGSTMLFMPPDGASGWWLMSASLVVYFGASMVGLSYSAWGAEIVTTYHGRAKLAGFREVATLVGLLMAAAIPAVTAIYGHGLDRYTMAILGWSVIILAPICIIAALRFVPEPPPLIATQAEPPLREMIAQIYSNLPFRLLCIGFIVIQIGVGVTNTSLVFFVSYYLQQPELVGPALVVSFLSVLLFVPVWVRISRKIGKHRAAGLSLLIAILCSSVFAFMLRPGDGVYFIVLMGVLGAVSAAFLTLPLAIMGDVIDYDALRNGVQRGGIFFGVWASAQQISPAIAVGATLPLLNWLGFDPTYANDLEAASAVRYMYCFGPLPFFFIGAVMLLRFPIDARRHDIIRRRLDSRRPAPAAVAALPAQQEELT